MSDADPLLAALALAYGAVVALAPLVQLHRVLKRRSSGDVSLTWLALYGGGCVVWLLYGASAGSTPLVVSQAASLVSVGATLAVAWRFRWAEPTESGGDGVHPEPVGGRDVTRASRASAPPLAAGRASRRSSEAGSGRAGARGRSRPRRAR